MDKRAEGLIKNWQKRNIAGFYCSNKLEAVDKITEIIPQSASIGLSGSQTLEEIGLVRHLESRGNKVFNPSQKSPGFSPRDERTLFSAREGALRPKGQRGSTQYKTGLTREENLKIRRQGTQADYYLTSANAISLSGELVFFSAYGNRTAGISYAQNVLVVCGINKITANIDEALKRAREYATPLNCKRLNWKTPCFKDGVCRKEVCLFPENKRMCCQILIIEAEVAPDRLKVILVGEKLGF